MLTIHALGYDRQTWVPVWAHPERPCLVGVFGELSRQVPVRIAPAGSEAEALLRTLRHWGYREAFVGRMEASHA